MNQRISIITVVYNAQDYLERTMLSVKNQTYPHKEHIIIDGASTDHTLEIVKKHESTWHYWISERDRGIYDAMNKGINLATGDWVIFLNGGDEFHAPDTLEKIFLRIPDSDKINMIYGDWINVFNSFKKYIKARIVTNKSIRKGMIVNHQSILVRRKIVPLYDLAFRISADYNWIIDIVKLSTPDQLFYVPIPIAHYTLGGVSENKIVKSLWESMMVTRKQFGILQVIKNSFLYLKILLRYLKNRYLGYDF